MKRVVCDYMAPE